MSGEEHYHKAMRDHVHKTQTWSQKLNHIALRMGDPEQRAKEWRHDLEKTSFIPPGVKQLGEAGLIGMEVGAKLVKWADPK